MGKETMPKALLRRYVQSMPAKAAAIDAHLGGFDGHIGTEARAGLRDLAHKLAGSAGMYGFDDISAVARAVVHAIDANASSSTLGASAKDLSVALRVHAGSEAS